MSQRVAADAVVADDAFAAAGAAVVGMDVGVDAADAGVAADVAAAARIVSTKCFWAVKRSYCRCWILVCVVGICWRLSLPEYQAMSRSSFGLSCKGICTDRQKEVGRETKSSKKSSQNKYE